MDDELRLQKQIRCLPVGVAVLAAAVLVLVCTAFRTTERPEGVLRARGLIIEDDQGRERILIGSPIPAAKNRIRTDLERATSVWAKRFLSAEKYMENYKTYQNDMSGILVLDENGFDRVGLGAPVPDPNTGKRIAPSSGLVINDDEGFERSGYGLLKFEHRYRVVLGIDNAQGQEGATLFVIDGGPVGLEVNDGSRHRRLGLYPKGKKEND